MPNASFIGFTGTPIEKTDANTRAVFGDYISIYDIQRAVTDKSTVPIYYESRISKLGLNAAELPKIDAEFAGYGGFDDRQLIESWKLLRDCLKKLALPRGFEPLFPP